MAIVVEEEKKSGPGIFGVLTLLLVIGAVAGAVYYVFFKQPDLVGQIAAPVNFKNTEQLSKINLNPKDVVDSLGKTFKQYVTPVTPGAKGRSNPFLGF